MQLAMQSCSFVACAKVSWTMVSMRTLLVHRNVSRAYVYTDIYIYIKYSIASNSSLPSREVTYFAYVRSAQKMAPILCTHWKALKPNAKEWNISWYHRMRIFLHSYPRKKLRACCSPHVCRALAVFWIYSHCRGVVWHLHFCKKMFVTMVLQNLLFPLGKNFRKMYQNSGFWNHMFCTC